MRTQAPIALHIDLDVIAKACPSHLLDRLMSRTPPSSPNKKGEAAVVVSPSSPEKLANASKLHEAHLQVSTSLRR